MLKPQSVAGVDNFGTKRLEPQVAVLPLVKTNELVFTTVEFDEYGHYCVFVAICEHPEQRTDWLEQVTNGNYFKEVFDLDGDDQAARLTLDLYDAVERWMQDGEKGDA